MSDVRDDRFYPTSELKMSVNGKIMNIVIIPIPIDDLEEFLISREAYRIIPDEENDDSMSEEVKIELQDMENYLSFFADKGLAEMTEIPFFIDKNTGKVLNPADDSMVDWCGFEESMSRFFYDFQIDGEIKMIGIIQINLNLVNILISEKQDLVGEGNLDISYDFISKVYSEFLEKKVEQNYLLVALDMEKNEPIGYVLEASMERGKNSKTELYLI